VWRGLSSVQQQRWLNCLDAFCGRRAQLSVGGL
jgi:hypothetical protein